ncbi:MAG: hypothetical protein JOZ10_16120 [Acidobacteria bacterium]|nr:hypothetical protein [Acidobacteriota bacterium]
MIPDTPIRLHWFTVEARKALLHMIQKLDAGMSTSMAYELASDELTKLYRQACLLEGAAPVNAMLDPVAVELQARFALDNLFHALKAGSYEGECRKHFWATFRKATNPHAV